MENLTGAQLLIRLLERQGVQKIFGIPGGTNLPLYDALSKSSIRHILARHEQGAGFMAQGYARSTGKAGVCFATSGPGATNLITAIADARADSVPLIAVTGQVSKSLMGTDAFQEVDAYGLSLPITKHNFLIRSIEELLTVIPEAFRIALSGRPGPVWVDVPKDIQTSQITIESYPLPGTAHLPAWHDRETILEAAALIKNSARPLIYAGGGAASPETAQWVRTLAEKNSIPAFCSLMGLGIFPEGHPLYLGMAGMHGSVAANGILDHADLLIVLGARFNDRTTGRVEEFGKHARILHIDADAAELDKIKKTHLALPAPLESVLPLLCEALPSQDRHLWNREIEEIRRESLSLAPEEEEIHPSRILKSLARAAGRGALMTTDVGQHQMWAAQHYPVFAPRSFLTSGGMGTMGFGLPAAIGAALAHPEKRVICLTGDGSILMNLQELATLAEQNLKVTVCVFNNGHLGLVRQQQKLFYGGNLTASRFECRPDFVAIANSFGIPAFEMNPQDHDGVCFEKALKINGPALINIPISEDCMVYPMVAPGAANRDQIGGRK